MRPTTACLTAALLGLLAADPATAQVEQDPSTGIITCATPPDHFDRRLVTGVGEGGRITGAIRLVSPAPAPRFTAAAGFLFREASSRHAAVHIALRPGTTDRIVVGIQFPGESRLTELGEYPANQWFPLSISYRDGWITVALGRRVTRQPARLTGPLLPALHCNSGRFEFRLGPGLGLGGELPPVIRP